MEKFRFYTGRTLDALTEGTFNPIQAIFEFVDNSYDHGDATKVEIRIIPVAGKGSAANRAPFKIVIADNGSGMTAEELIEAMAVGTQQGNHGPTKISDAGIGAKLAALSLGDTFEYITRDADAKVWYANLNLEQLRSSNNFIGPHDVAPCNPDELWEEWALDSTETGTVLVLSGLRNDYFSSCGSWVEGLHLVAPDRLGARYAAPINSGALTVCTAINGGVTRDIEAVDYLRFLEPGTKELFNETCTYTPKTDKSVTCTYQLLLHSVEKGSPKEAGIYVVVGDTMIMLDKDTWLGMYSSGASHSYRWKLRAQISFDTKDEFRKVLQLKSFKHEAGLRGTSFGDTLRNSSFGAEVTQHERDREQAVEDEKRLKGLRTVGAEEKAFVNALNTDKLIYGASKSLRKFLGSVNEFRSGKFDDPRSLGLHANDKLYYNPRNPKVNDLMGNTGTPVSRRTGRALVAAYAFAEKLKREGSSLTPEEQLQFVANLVTML